MKRSAMLREIRNELWSLQQTSQGAINLDADAIKTISNAILMKIEQKGMMPPLGLDKSQIYPEGHQYYNPDFKGNLEHTWEPE